VYCVYHSRRHYTIEPLLQLLYAAHQFSFPQISRMTRPAVALVAERLLAEGKGVLAITGAGCSTESGIPDYRSPTGVYRRPDFKPLTAQRFLKSNSERQRYWARSMMGFSTVSQAKPNASHQSLHNLVLAEWVRHIVTQNVDGLHHAAANGDIEAEASSAHLWYTTGNLSLTELHGNIHMVRCASCSFKKPRAILQQELLALNRELVESLRAQNTRALADGDASLPDGSVESMKLIDCPECGGMLRPDVVLFGENVPKSIVDFVYNEVNQCSALLCCGTSLQVYSALRFVEAARNLGKPIIIVNHGATRADKLATLQVDEPSIASFLRDLSARLSAH
jgi:NAD+-dependent protein deacetylase sirtuin 4